MDGVKSTLNRVVSAKFEIPSFLSSGAKDLINCLLKKVENLILFDFIHVHKYRVKYAIFSTQRSD